MEKFKVWARQRRKMWAAGFVSALTMAALAGVEKSLGITIDLETKAMITGTVTGFVVERIPNAE